MLLYPGELYRLLGASSSRYSPPQCSHTMLHGEVVSYPKTGVTGLLILHFSRCSPPQCSHTMLHGEVVSYPKTGVTSDFIEDWSAPP